MNRYKNWKINKREESAFVAVAYLVEAYLTKSKKDLVNAFRR